jgi:hypothetical protein
MTIVLPAQLRTLPPAAQPSRDPYQAVEAAVARTLSDEPVYYDGGVTTLRELLDRGIPTILPHPITGAAGAIFAESLDVPFMLHGVCMTPRELCAQGVQYTHSPAAPKRSCGGSSDKDAVFVIAGRRQPVTLNELFDYCVENARHILAPPSPARHANGVVLHPIFDHMAQSMSKRQRRSWQDLCEAHVFSSPRRTTRALASDGSRSLGSDGSRSSLGSLREEHGIAA